MTPKHYASDVGAQPSGGDIATAAVVDTGCNADSRGYDNPAPLVEITSSRNRRSGIGGDIHFAVARCSLGAILVAQRQRGVCAILLGDDAQRLVGELHDRFIGANLIAGDRNFQRLVAKVISFIEAPASGLDLPLELHGTAFQQRVWHALRNIAPGSTASYSEIARRIGAPNAARAVAQACAANALAVAIPCHRVVRNDGAISGYRWGVQRKRALLAREAKT